MGLGFDFALFDGFYVFQEIEEQIGVQLKVSTL